MAVDVSLQTWFVANLPDGWQVQEGKIDWDKVAPWLFYRRSSSQQERLLSGALCNNFVSVYDIELVGPDIDLIQTTSDEIRTALQSIPCGSMLENTFVGMLFVEDASDDYIPRSVLETDTGYHVSTFQLTLYHAA